MKESETRNVYNPEDKTWDYGRRRTTHNKGNCQVTFPRKSRNLDEEARLEMMRVLLMSTYRRYGSENCVKGGLKSLRACSANWAEPKSNQQVQYK